MSDKPKGLPKPDGDGRWAIYYKGNAYGHIFNVKIIEGVPCHANGLPIVFSDNDRWHRCYVPGLDKTGWPECDYPADALAAAWDSLKRAGVFTTKATFVDIDALAAQRDEARQEVERLKELAESRYQLSESAISQVARLESELATLRQQQGKGEGDAAKVEGRLVADETPVKVERVWTYSTFMFSDNHPQLLESVRETTWWGEEASRAT